MLDISNTAIKKAAEKKLSCLRLIVAIKNSFNAFYHQSKYIAEIIFFIPSTLLKRVVFGKDPIWKSFFFQSWGMLPPELEKRLAEKNNIWINSESGGELTQIFSLCKMLKQQFPEYNLLLSTHKYDAYRLAQKVDGVDYAFFSPWDITWVVRKVLGKIRPILIMSIEVVTAPVLFREAHRLGFKNLSLQRLYEPESMRKSNY